MELEQMKCGTIEKAYSSTKQLIFRVPMQYLLRECIG